MMNYQNIDPTSIKTETQFRTRNGFDSSLQDLQTSIAINGLIQPITVRQDEDGYTVVAGHRRLAAMRNLKWTSIPCMVTDSKAEYKNSRAQLVENLQRESLDLVDTANAVRALATRAGTIGSGLSQLSTDIGKSKTWVSRHLSLTDPKFSAHARALLDAGKITDLEVAHGLHQIEKTKGPNRAEALRVFGLEIENGRMSRRLAADLLAMAKTTPDNQDEPTSDDTSSDEESSNTAAKTKPIRLSPEQYALYLEKGGIEWLVAQLVA